MTYNAADRNHTGRGYTGGI